MAIRTEVTPIRDQGHTLWRPEVFVTAADGELVKAIVAAGGLPLHDAQLELLVLLEQARRFVSDAAALLRVTSADLTSPPRRLGLS